MMILHPVQSERRFRIPASFIGLGLCLSFFLFFYWSHPPASLLLLVIAAALAWIRLEIAIALLPLTFPYYLDLKPLQPGGFPAFSLNELGLLICVGVALLRNLLLLRERLATWEWARNLWQQAHLFLPPALLFLIGASLALLVSPDQHESLRAYREEIIEPLLYFLLILRYLRTRTDLARTIGALILSALVVSSTGIIQGLFHQTSYLFIVDASTFRIKGPFGSPNNLAFLLDRTLPILLALALLSVSHHQDVFQQPPWRDPLRWLCLVVMIPLFWALYWTDSHGAEIAIMVVLFLYFVFEVRNWIAILAVAGIGILGLGLFRSHVVQLLDGAGHGPVSVRIFIWKIALLIIRDHFLLGTGPDSFHTLYGPTAPSSYGFKLLGRQGISSIYLGISHPHNFFFDFWISTGLLGLVALFWLSGAFAIAIARTYRLCAELSRGRVLQQFLLGIAGCMVASFVHGMVDNLYFVPDLAMTFWFFMGMVLVLQGIVQQGKNAIHDQAGRHSEEAISISD
jgi:putative inorganic carbon (HCO3(-)) transporter